MKKLGLPSNYNISVTSDDLDDMPPVDVGDFLDEDGSISFRATSVRKKSPEADLHDAQKVVGYIGSSAKPEQNESIQPGVDRVREGHLETVAVEEHVSLPATPRKPKRRQINMTHQTMVMVEELVGNIARYSNEPNPSASELVRALISSAHEAKELMDLSTVPARGHWGSSTSKIFVDSLKSTIQRAIAQHQMHRGGTRATE